MATMMNWSKKTLTTLSEKPGWDNGTKQWKQKNTWNPGKAKTIFCEYFSILQKQCEGRTKQTGSSEVSRTGVKGELGDVPQPEIVHKKEELSLKDSLSLDPLKK